MPTDPNLQGLADSESFAVLHICSGDLWAGAEVMLFNLVLEQRKQGIVPAVVVFNQGILHDKLIAETIKVFTIGEQNHSSFSIINEIRHLIKTYRPAVVHTHGFKENILGSLAGMGTGTASIRTEHGLIEVETLKSKLLHALDVITGFFMQDHTVFVSETTRQGSSRLLKHRCTVIFNGIEIQPLSENLAKRSTHIGIVARLVPVKRHDIFLDAARSLLRETSPDTHVCFHVIGGGPLEESIRDACADESQIKIHGHVNSMMSIWEMLDLLVITSDHEGIPMTLLEAFNLGIPTLVRNFGEIAEILGQHQASIVVDSALPEHFADAIRIHLNTPADAKKNQIRNAHKFLTDNFSIEHTTEQYLNVYLGLKQANKR